jgi:hypothetical protein
MLTRAYLLAPFLLSLSIAAPAAAAPEMFEASFIFHAWGNDVTSGNSWSPAYISNFWTAAPLGYNCAHAEPYTTNGKPSPKYCSPAKMQRGHPATGVWTASVGTGTPPAIVLAQSAFAVTASGALVMFPPYLQSVTYATFVNAAGSFFAGGGAAAGVGYNNRTGMNGSGTWRVRAGGNAFGGAMGLLGKYGATGHFTITGKTGTYNGVSSWAMVPDIGRPLYNTQIGTGSAGTPIYQNPFSKTDMWYNTTPKGKVDVHTIRAIGSGTLWTTGQVGNFAKTGPYYTSLYRTGYDNRTPGGRGAIQLVTPTLTHWLSPGYNTHTAQVGLLTIRVPEPGVTLLFATGAVALVGLRYMSRRH